MVWSKRAPKYCYRKKPPEWMEKRRQENIACAAFWRSVPESSAYKKGDNQRIAKLNEHFADGTLDVTKEGHSKRMRERMLGHEGKCR